MSKDVWVKDCKFVSCSKSNNFVPKFSVIFLLKLFLIFFVNAGSPASQALPLCVPPPFIATGHQPFAVPSHIPTFQPPFPANRPIPVPGSNSLYTAKLSWILFTFLINHLSKVFPFFLSFCYSILPKFCPKFLVWEEFHFSIIQLQPKNVIDYTCKRE